MADEQRPGRGYSRLKLLMLVNWREDGKWHLLHSLRQRVQDVAVQQPVLPKRTTFGKLIALSCYLSEYYVPVTAVFKRKRFDVVISWQMRLGVCYGLLKRFFHAGKPPVHIIQDFHIDLTQTRWLYRLQVCLLQLAIPGIDYFFTTSAEEEIIYSRMFNIPLSRIRFLPLVESPASFKEPVHPGADYIFAFGKSDRDFDTLIQAVTPLGIQTYILSRGYCPQVSVPEHVHLIRDYVSNTEMCRWISFSRMVVLPLKDYRISAGQISMLETMAMAKPLVVAENMATREYAVHRQTAMFYPSGDIRNLKTQILYLWEHPETAEEIGRQGRISTMTLNKRRMAIMGDVLTECAALLPEYVDRTRV